MSLKLKSTYSWSRWLVAFWSTSCLLLVRSGEILNVNFCLPILVGKISASPETELEQYVLIRLPIHFMLGPTLWHRSYSLAGTWITMSFISSLILANILVGESCDSTSIPFLFSDKFLVKHFLDHQVVFRTCLLYVD